MAKPNRKYRHVTLSAIAQPAIRNPQGRHGWHAFIADCARYLDVDPTEMCRAFTRRARFVLPRGAAHSYVEPVYAHFRQHRCGLGPAPAFQCAAARALLALELAIPVERERPLLAPVVEGFKVVVDALANVEPGLAASIDLVRAAAISGRLGPLGSTGYAPYEEAVELLAAIRRCGTGSAEFVLRHEMAPDPLSGSTRRQVINAEGELLAAGVLPKQVAVYLRVCSLGKTDGAQVVRTRAERADEALQVHVD
jgi:hypothetical protein